ncbi:MAG: phosphotransferase, partial [Glaciimonas sp.]|nr:phosphotransferase [Glaciimonas sp.]
MAVFTPVNLDDLNSWLSQFLLDKATGIKGILSGIKNRNFFINTETGEYVVTVFEKLTFKQLPFYLELMPHLAHRDIAVPTPIANKDGAIINVLHGKPAAIVSKLAGESQMSPGRLHCREVGETLAKMHLAAQDFPIYQPNLRGMSWWRDTTMVMLPFLSAETQQLMRTEMVFQEKFAASQPYQNLPNGPVYADLFRNNV